MSLVVHDAVAALAQELRRRVGEPRYDLWFASKTRFTFHDDQLVVGVANHFYQDWLQQKFAEEIRQSVRAVAGQPLAVRFAIDPQLFQAARRGQDVGPTPGASTLAARGSLVEDPRSKDSPSDDLPAMDLRPGTTGHERPAIQGSGAQGAAAPGGAKPRTRRWRRLEDFVVGACNRVAHASALSLVEAPGMGPSPLVLYGPVSTGKTHLLEGIYVGLRRARPEWRVCYTTAEEFTNRFVQAVRLGKLPSFRRLYRDCDALLLDDLHFLASKPATMEEFLHTFDALHADECPMAVSCDCHPRLTDQLLPELIDRLLGGAVWALLPPEPDTRLAVLRAKAARIAGALVPDDVLAYIADHLRGNVRELLGTLHSLVHLSRVQQRRIDLALAREVLAEVLRHHVRVRELADVDRAVREALRLESGALQSRKRGWAVSHPRMLAMFLARKHTAATYTDIGRYFGGRNHSTAVAAEKKVRRWLQDGSPLVLGDQRLPVRDMLDRVERELLR